MESFDQAIDAARAAQRAGDIIDFHTGRKGDSTAGARFIIARSDQGSFVWWPAPLPADEYEYWE